MEFILQKFRKANIYPKIKKSVSAFVDAIEFDREITEREIVLLLDQIALVTNYLRFVEPDVNDEVWSDPPSLKSDELREKISKKFPNYGFYNIPHTVSEDIANTEILVGDAIDDIYDIYHDFKEIEWRWKNTSKKGTYWHFNWGFNNHWNRHLRNV